MQENYYSLITKLKSKKIMFYGIGRSNLPFIKMLTEENISVIVYDEKPPEYIDENILKNLLNNQNVSLRLADKRLE